MNISSIAFSYANKMSNKFAQNPISFRGTTAISNDIFIKSSNNDSVGANVESKENISSINTEAIMFIDNKISEFDSQIEKLEIEKSKIDTFYQNYSEKTLKNEDFQKLKLEFAKYVEKSEQRFALRYESENISEKSKNKLLKFFPGKYDYVSLRIKSKSEIKEIINNELKEYSKFESKYKEIASEIITKLEDAMNTDIDSEMKEKLEKFGTLYLNSDEIKSYINDPNGCLNQKAKIEKEINKLNNNKKEYTNARNQLQNTNVPFFENKSVWQCISTDDKIEMLEKNPHLMTEEDFANQHNIKLTKLYSAITKKLIPAFAYKLKGKGYRYFINTTSDEIKQLLDTQEKGYESVEKIAKEINKPIKWINCLIEKYGVDTITVKNLFEFININDPKYNEVLELIRDYKFEPFGLSEKIHNKFVKYNINDDIISSKYYIHTDKNNENKPIPINELIKLGFGPIEKIREAVQNGKLNVISKEIINKDGEKRKKFFIDTRGKYAEKAVEILGKIRFENSNIIHALALCKEYNLTQEDIYRAIAAGELEYINQFILPSDDTTLFFDLTKEKNQNFLKSIQDKIDEKLYNKEKINLEKSLRARLAWYFSPETKNVMSEHSKNNGFLGKIFNKIDNEEPLTAAEDIVYLGYLQDCWDESGTGEFSLGMQKAIKIINMCKEDGFDATISKTSDPKIKEILEKYKDLF